MRNLNSSSTARNVLRRIGARRIPSGVHPLLHSTRPVSRVGRWLSRDPLPNAELSQGASLYWYVGNNPINGNDPLGEWTFWQATGWWYLTQVAGGLIAGIQHAVDFKKACDGLSNGQSTVIQTASTRTVTMSLLPVFVVFNDGEPLRIKIWKDECGDCHQDWIGSLPES